MSVTETDISDAREERLSIHVTREDAISRLKTEIPNVEDTSRIIPSSSNNAQVESAAAGSTLEQLEIEPDQSAAAEDETQYPTGTKRTIILLSIGLVLIMAEMDFAIVAIAVPALTDQFHTVKDVGWYSAAFRLSVCSFQFMFGKLYKLFSVKKVFMTSVVIFLVGSIICSTAPTSLAFVVGRAVTGFGTAGILAGCFTLIVQTMPFRKRPLWTSIANVVEGSSTIAAPLLGGFLVQVNWRWCFIINIPLSVVVLGLLACFLQDVRPAERTTWKYKLSNLDLVGNLILVPSLTCLFMALSWAGTTYAWNSPTVIGLFCGFAVLLAAFAVEQWIKGDTATLPPRILKNRTVLSGFAFSICCNSAINVVQFYLPTWLQAIKGYSPAKSGLLLVPGIIGFMISGLIHGVGVGMIGYYVPFMLAASVLMPIFTGLITTFTIDTSLGKLLAIWGFSGFAGGIGFQAPQVAVQNTLPADDINIGLAIILFAQNFGPAIFVSAAQTIFTNRLSANFKHLGPGLNATTIDNMGLSDLKNIIGAGKLHEVLSELDHSLVQTWYLAVALTCCLIIGSATMEWKSVKQKRS